MSVSAASKNKAKKDLEKEVEYLEQQLYDASVYAGLLKEGCEAGIKCRDLVLRNGSQASILKVCECVELTLAAAELISPFPTKDEEFDGCIYCSVCERFFGIESERAGKCLFCESMAMELP